MIRGLFPGSLMAPSADIQANLKTKQQRIFELYRKFFKDNLHSDAVLNRATLDRTLAAQIGLYTGMVNTMSIMHSDYFKAKLDEFVQDVKAKGLAKDYLGRGNSGFLLLVEEQGNQIVVKLPINPATDFDSQGHYGFVNLYDHAQKLSRLEGVDHSLLARPVDEMCESGKVMTMGKLGGKDLCNVQRAQSEGAKVFQEMAQLRNFSPERIAELIKIYKVAYEKQINILGYGQLRNTRVVEDGKAIALYDLGSEPMHPDTDEIQLRILNTLVGDDSLAAALYMVMTNGNLSLLANGESAKGFRDAILLGQPEGGKTFFEYRKNLLKETLIHMIKSGTISQDELIQSLQVLRDLNRNGKDVDLEYLNIFSMGLFINKGRFQISELLDYFRENKVIA